MAATDGYKGDTVAYGVGRIYVRDKITCNIIGGFASEYRKRYVNEFVSLTCAESIAYESLKESLYSIVTSRYDLRCVEVFDMKIVTSGLNIKQNYGTCLVAIGFVNYILPVFSCENNCHINSYY